MRHGPAGRRLRNRGHNNTNSNNAPRRGGNGGGGNRNQVFDSNGPDVRIRGTAHQIQEKYAALAKDASSSGDRILAESYLQHAEHYQRIINTWIEQSGGRDFGGGHAPEEEMSEEEMQSPERRFDIRQPSRPQQQEHADLGLPPSITGEMQGFKRAELADA